MHKVLFFGLLLTPIHKSPVRFERFEKNMFFSEKSFFAPLIFTMTFCIMNSVTLRRCGGSTPTRCVFVFLRHFYKAPKTQNTDVQEKEKVKIGFDNDKYLKTQSAHIRERIA